MGKRLQSTTLIRSSTLRAALCLLAAFLLTAVVSACRPGPPPSDPQGDLPAASSSADSEPALSRAPETFTLDEAAALYERIRNEMEKPDPDLAAGLDVDLNAVQENTREFETGARYGDVPGFEDSFRSFEQGDFLSAHDELETAFRTFIMGECFSALTSECIILPEEQVIAVDPQFEYLPEPGKGGLRFSVLRQDAALKIVILLRVLAALAESVEVKPSPVGTPPPATEAEPTPAATLVPTPTPEVVPGQPQAIPPQTHTVAAGETLFGIAMLYGASVDELVQLNNVPNRDLIYAGQTLVLPGRVEAAPVATPTVTPTPTPTSSSPLP